MGGIFGTLQSCFRAQSQRPEPKHRFHDGAEPAAENDLVDTLSGKVALGNVAVAPVSPAWVSTTSRALAPTDAPSVFALSTARLPGGGFVAASSDGKVSHLDGAGKLVQDFVSCDGKPVYSVCAVGDSYVAGTSRANGSGYRVRLWDVGTHACIGEQPAGEQYTDMIYAGGGRIVGSNSQVGDVWLHDLGTGDVRALTCGVDAYKLGPLTALGDGHVAARVRADSSIPATLMTWRADRDWQNTTRPIPADGGLGNLLLLDKQRLMVLGDDPSRAAVWDVAHETWLGGPQATVPGTIATHRWVEPSAQHDEACRRYDERSPQGATNPHALSVEVAHMLLEKRQEGVVAWDLKYGTPAWGGTTLAIEPTGALFGCLYRGLQFAS